MKVAIIGANGQLGTDLTEVLSTEYEVKGLNHADIEITDIDNVKKAIGSFEPDILLNTAAYNNVPEAEKFPDKAFLINAIGALNLARVCQEMGTKFLHYSTDYVFDGKKGKPYTEEDCPNPLSVYASTKLSGEYFALNYCEQSYVVRVSGIYGKVPSRSKGANFITTMLKLAKEKPEVRVVDDEILTPTPTYRIAMNTAALLKKDAFGLYHMSSEGQCSWYEFAQVIWDIFGLKTPLLPTSVKEFNAPVKRPFYSVLENKRLNSINCNHMIDWKSDLINFLKGSF